MIEAGRAVMGKVLVTLLIGLMLAVAAALSALDLMRMVMLHSSETTTRLFCDYFSRLLHRGIRQRRANSDGSI
jgi:hypothetical protein